MQIAGLVRGLLRRGHRAVVVTRPGSALAARLQGEIPIVQYPLCHALDLPSLARLIALFRRLRPQVVHLHSPVAHTLGGIAARLAGVPVVIAHKRTDFPPTPGRLNRWRFHGLVQRVIAVSEAGRQSVLTLGVPPESVARIYSGVDTERFRPDAVTPACPGVPEGVPMVACVAPLQWRKGQDLLIRALAGLPAEHAAVWLALVGEGEERRRLEGLARECGVARRVVFTGYLADVRPVLARCQVAVLPSRREALGVAGLETMAMGKPLVASDTGGLAEIVAPGETGVLVPPGELAPLTEALAALLGDPALAATMGGRARARAVSLFSMEHTVSETERLYQDLLSLRQKGGRGSG